MKKMDNKDKIMRKENIPNMLVVLRMIFAFVIIVILVMDLYGVPSPAIYTIKDLFIKEDGVNVDFCTINLWMLLAGILFVLASLTDWLDGFIARKNNWVSDFGKFWDPIADKVLVNSVLILFAVYGLIPYPIPVIMIARDVAVDADRMIAAKKNVVVAANIYGKMKTVLQMVGLIFIFFLGNCKDFVNHAAMYWGVQNLLMYLATIMSVTSGIIYFVDIAKATKKAKADAK